MHRQCRYFKFLLGECIYFKFLLGERSYGDDRNNGASDQNCYPRLAS